MLEIKHYDVSAIELLTGENDFLHRLLEVSGDASVSSGRRPALHIPYWQRDYDWGKPQIDRFLRSIGESAADSKPFHLGTLVVSVHANFPEMFVLVDGQQRLRTLQTLIVFCRSHFPREDESRVGTSYLPLVSGVGRDPERLRGLETKEALDEELATDGRKDLFLPEKLAEYGFADLPPEAWLPLVKFRVVLHRYTPEGVSQDDEFDATMSALFARVNRQAKPLDDLDVTKAKLLFRCRALGFEAEAARLADAWELARMLQLVPLSEADASLVDMAVFAPVFPSEAPGRRDPLTILPYDPKAIRLQFTRYVLLAALYAGLDVDTGKLMAMSVDETLARGTLLRALSSVLGTASDEESEAARTNRLQDSNESLRAAEAAQLVDFIRGFESITNIFIHFRSFLLLSRRNRLEDDSSEAENAGFGKELELTPGQKRLLFFQAYANGGLPGVWFFQPLLLELLKALAPYAEREAPLEEKTCDGILSLLENALFQRLTDKTSEHAVLTARDWFLWRVFLDEAPSNELTGVAVDALEAAHKAAPDRFEEKSGEALLERLRKVLRPWRPIRMPTTTGAGEIEHWIAADRGRASQALRIRLDALSNKAHISNGLNQSLSNDGILRKAAYIDRNWWPTLQFLAAFTVCGMDWAASENPTKLEHIDEFLKPLDAFWQVVEARLISSEMSGSAAETDSNA